MNDLEIFLAQASLEADAGKATALLVEDHFDGTRADAYLESVHYAERLAAWKAAR